MTSKINDNHAFLNKEMIFQLFKYSVYLLLSMNIYHFFLEDYDASSQTFSNGIELEQVIVAFAQTIDTLAWVVLLLLFELETYVLNDEQIKGWVKWSIEFLSIICYVFIIYSFSGYIEKYTVLHNIVPFSINDVCTLVGSSFTYIEDIDKYSPLTIETCKSFNSSSLFQVVGTEIISTEKQMIETQRLSLVDVINSANWLVIVALLKFDVYLQLRGRLSERIVYYSTRVKVVLYSILLFAAVYWGTKGNFLNFWDAFLWLVAFVFIELNVFEWNSETREETSKTQSEESELADR